VQGWLAVGEASTIYGPPDTGKSILALDIALHVAAGLNWHGHAAMQASVLAFLLERADVSKRRASAFVKMRGIPNPQLLLLIVRLTYSSRTRCRM